MNLQRIAFSIVLALAAQPVFAAAPVPADNMGLSKQSVFVVPEPKVYKESGGQAGQNKLLPRAFLNAPPQIPHGIGDFLPITAQSNLCIACHNLPDQWGKKLKAGEARAIPQSHYTDLRTAPGKVTDQLIGARYNCNQCHVPQMNAKPLVDNIFSAKRGK